MPPLLGPPPTTGEHLLYDAELTIREKKLVDFVTAKHTGLVNGARTRAAEYLLAAHAARNQPPADDFMLLADPGDLNPSMITRWRQFLDDTKKRTRPGVAALARASPSCPTRSSREKAPALLKAVTGGNKLVAAAFADAAEVDEGGRRALRQAARRRRPAVEGSRARGRDAARRSGRGGAAPRAVRPRSPADAPLALDWGFLSLFPDRATQGEYQKLLKRRWRTGSRRGRRGRWCCTTRRGRTTRASSTAATPAGRASRCRGSS